MHLEISKNFKILKMFSSTNFQRRNLDEIMGFFLFFFVKMHRAVSLLSCYMYIVVCPRRTDILTTHRYFIEIKILVTHEV